MVTVCGVVTVDGKEAEQSELQLFTIFGRGLGFCVCVWSTGVKAFPNPILPLFDLIGSFSCLVGLP